MVLALLVNLVPITNQAEGLIYFYLINFEELIIMNLYQNLSILLILFRGSQIIVITKEALS